MTGLNISAFFNGMATAYFAIYACQLLASRRRTRFRTLLGYIFVYWTFSNFKDIVQSQPGLYNTDVLNVIIMMDGWSAVTFACFLFELTMPGWVTLRRVLMLAMPFALFSATYVIWPARDVLNAYLAFLIIFGVAITLIGYAKAETYTKYVRDNFSNIDEIDISWIKHVYFIGFLSMLLWLVISVIRLPVADAVYYLSSIVMWQMTLSYSRNLRQVKPEKVTTPEPGDGSMPRTYPFAGTLEKIVEDEQLYLNPDLSLANLTARIGTNRTYLSDYFCNVKRITFYDYINSLRINKMSTRLMAEHPEYTLDYIASLSGFNSMSTFRRAFRKYTGMNPGRFRENADAPGQHHEEAGKGAAQPE